MLSNWSYVHEPQNRFQIAGIRTYVISLKGKVQIFPVKKMVNFGSFPAEKMLRSTKKILEFLNVVN